MDYVCLVRMAMDDLFNSTVELRLVDKTAFYVAHRAYTWRMRESTWAFCLFEDFLSWPKSYLYGSKLGEEAKLQTSPKTVV